MGLKNTLLGVLDGVYARLSRCSANKRATFFEDGLGDEELLDAMEAEFFTRPSRLPGLAALSIEWDEATRTTDAKKGIELVRGSFLSPAQHYLPGESATAHVLLVRPSGVADEQLSGIVVHAAATGHQGYSTRRKLNADALASKRNIASVLLISPCYGKRAPAGQYKHYARTVSEYLRCCVATYVELAMIARWAVDKFPESPVTLHGYSLGGAMASDAAAMLRCSGEDGRVVGLCSVVGTSSPLVLLRCDYMRSQVNLAALEGTVAQREATLEKWLRRGEMHRCLDAWGLNDGASGYRVVACIISASGDRIAIPSEAVLLEQTVKSFVKPEDFTTHWIDGGHVSTLVWSDAEVQFIVQNLADVRRCNASMRKYSSRKSSSRRSLS